MKRTRCGWGGYAQPCSLYYFLSSEVACLPCAIACFAMIRSVVGAHVSGDHGVPSTNTLCATSGVLLARHQTQPAFCILRSCLMLSSFEKKFLKACIGFSTARRGMRKSPDTFGRLGWIWDRQLVPILAYFAHCLFSSIVFEMAHTHSCHACGVDRYSGVC